MSGPTDGAGAAPPKPPALSVEQIEAQIAQRRDQLAKNVDALLYEVQPKVIVGRQKVKAQQKVRLMTHTPDGQLRTERIAGVLGATAVALIGIGLLRRRFG